MKLFPHHPLPPPVKGWHVPVPKTKLLSLVDPTWDLTLQRIIPYIDGVSDVRRIAYMADVALDLAQSALRHLLMYDTVVMLDMFFFSNCYAVRPAGIHDFIANIEGIVDECANYVCIISPAAGSPSSVPGTRVSSASLHGQHHHHGVGGGGSSVEGGGGSITHDNSGMAGLSTPLVLSPATGTTPTQHHTHAHARHSSHTSSLSAGGGPDTGPGASPSSSTTATVTATGNTHPHLGHIRPATTMTTTTTTTKRLPNYVLIKLMTTFCVGRSVLEWLKFHQEMTGIEVLHHVDVRRLVQFGVIKGILYRVHKYVVSKQYLSALATGIAVSSVDGDKMKNKGSGKERGETPRKTPSSTAEKRTSLTIPLDRKQGSGSSHKSRPAKSKLTTSTSTSRSISPSPAASPSPAPAPSPHQQHQQQGQGQAKGTEAGMGSSARHSRDGSGSGSHMTAAAAAARRGGTSHAPNETDDQDTREKVTREDPLQRYFDGTHPFDQIITERNLTDAEVMEKLKRRNSIGATAGSRGGTGGSYGGGSRGAVGGSGGRGQGDLTIFFR